MTKKAFTLVEIIVVIIVAGILSVGTFIALKEIYLRSAKSKAISELSRNSELTTSQVASLLYDRVPSSVIGYNTVSKNYQSIYEINNTYNVLEWIATARESFEHRDFSGFVDMNASNSLTDTLNSPDTNISAISQTIQKKFDTTQNVYDNDLVALVFAGSFDSGSLVLTSDFNNSFGWHGGNSSLIYDINSSSSGNNIVLKSHPNEIYEKYYLVDTAYSLARGEDLNRTILENNCGLDLSNISNEGFKNTLFLFYNYRPWKSETFCGDPNITGTETREGNVTVMATEVEGFRINLANSILQFSLTLKRDISSDKKHSVTISKQKVIF